MSRLLLKSNKQAWVTAPPSRLWRVKRCRQTLNGNRKANVAVLTFYPFGRWWQGSVPLPWRRAVELDLDSSKLEMENETTLDRPRRQL